MCNIASVIGCNVILLLLLSSTCCVHVYAYLCVCALQPNQLYREVHRFGVAARLRIIIPITTVTENNNENNIIIYNTLGIPCADF